ncbi:MAG: gliding motility-associated C-terminal domain-containing protein [Taibaiella sp.]|nr:gliding motility-associated C-terminal domain-containing protein [Taibaiella sp.]
MAFAKSPVTPAKGMTASGKNYSTFTTHYTTTSDEAKLANTNAITHPELGTLFPEAPCSTCYELIAERTEKTKKFVIEGTGGREVALQTSTDAMHFRDSTGRWLTIDSRLREMGPGIYSSDRQPVPVTVDARSGYTSIGTGNELRFNSDLELVFVPSGGREQSLGRASWTNLTVGDEGAYVTDAWPGIDIEIHAGRGSVKTNFIVQHAFPGLVGGTILIRDYWQMRAGLKLSAPAETDWKGNLEVRDSTGVVQYRAGAAVAYEANNAESTITALAYGVNGSLVDIKIPGEMLARGADSYPLVIDPLITLATISTVGGSSYSPTKTVSCNYVNAATVPAGVKVTDVRWTFNYTASGGALLLHGAVDYTLGTCRSPGVAGFFWYCNLATAGTCTGSNVSIMSDIGSCVPAPSCSAYDLNLNMRFYQNFAATLPCATTYITAGTPLTVTVFGRTVETSNVTSAGGLTSICTGQSVTLSTTPGYGVPPYTVVWTPGSVAGNPVTLTPVATTAYTATVTDACGNTATAATTIAVSPIAGNTGSNIVCVGGTTTLSNPTGGGAWSSSSGAVAVVGPSTGLVTGVSPGTTIISYTTPLGCYATTVVSVIPMPGSIGGVPSMCVGASTTLSNPIPSGTWSTSTPAVAVVGGGTGLVTGIAAGTATITYSTSPGCTATITVTVYPLPIISGVTFTNPTTCGSADGTMTIHGLVSGVTYTVSYVHNTIPALLTATANASGNIVLTGLTAGLYTTIAVKSPEGCLTTWAGTVTLVDSGSPPVPSAGSNTPVCAGGTIKLTATSAPGVSYAWTGPAGFSSTEQNPEIAPAATVNGGTYSVTARLGGCLTLPGTVNVVVAELPNITSVSSTNPVTCGGNEGSITLEGLTGGATYTVVFTINGAGTTVVTTADGLGKLTMYGRVAGTYANIYVVAGGCGSNTVGPVTLVNPDGPPPSEITSNAPICQGLTLLLFGENSKLGGSYYWTGPDGFASAQQNPSIPNVMPAAQGVYTLAYTWRNCTSFATAEINLQPVVELTDVTADKYVVNFGDSVQLHARGATYYNWTPHNGTIRNPYIPEPYVRPKDAITVYTVNGMNEWGCHDSELVTIKVLFDEEETIPNAFTPNGDGLNDVFRIGRMKYKKLIDFTVYDRWGQEVYHNPWDPNGGWDGTFNGVPQDMGTYYYSITIESASGKLRYYKGDVTLIR